jgi:hypothetical protein
LENSGTVVARKTPRLAFRLPRDQAGNIIYNRGVTLLETWRAMENLVDQVNPTWKGGPYVEKNQSPNAGFLLAGFASATTML